MAVSKTIQIRTALLNICAHYRWEKLTPYSHRTGDIYGNNTVVTQSRKEAMKKALIVTLATAVSAVLLAAPALASDNKIYFGATAEQSTNDFNTMPPRAGMNDATYCLTSR